MAEKTKAERFLDAFNNIDYSLRARFGLNRSMGFSDLIRRCVSLNYVVRKYEDELNGKYVVRIFSKTPFIDIVCSSLTEAQITYKNIQKSRRVVNINEMRFGS